MPEAEETATRATEMTGMMLNMIGVCTTCVVE